MKNSEHISDILEHPEYYLDNIEKDLEAGPAIKKIQSERPFDNLFRTYNRLYILSTIIIDDNLKNDLQNLIQKIYTISENDYSINDQIEWLDKLASTVGSAENVLISKVSKNIRNLTKKEVAFIELHSENDEIIDRIRLIQGSIDNYVHFHRPPTTQQTYINVLVNEAVNFRLLTLSDDQAWDYMAQSILEQTKIKP